MEKTKILVVTSDKYLRQKIRSLLRNAKFKNLVGATSGSEGIKLYKENDIGLVLCDVNLSQMKALYFLQKILIYDAKAKVILIAHQTTKLIPTLQAIQLGVVDTLIDPNHPWHFICTIRRVLERDKINTEDKFLLEIFSQLIEDVIKYLDPAISDEIQTHIVYILRTVEIDFQRLLYYNEKRNRIQIRDDGSVSFSKLNEILIQILESVSAKIETYLPYAKNIIVEAFRLVYYRNLRRFQAMNNKIKYPDWLNHEVEWMDQILCIVNADEDERK